MLKTPQGEIVPDSLLERLSRRLNRNRVTIIKNEWAQEILQKSGAVAQFIRFKDGSAAILLRSNPTRYQLVHELKHYEHWLADPENYPQISKLERETYVYNAIQKSHHWKRFSKAEKTHATEYIRYTQRLFQN